MNYKLIMLLCMVIIGAKTVDAATDAATYNSDPIVYASGDSNDEEKLCAPPPRLEEPKFKPPLCNAQLPKNECHSAWISLVTISNQTYTIAYKNNDGELVYFTMRIANFNHATSLLNDLRTQRLFTYLSVVQAALDQPLEEASLNITLLENPQFYAQLFQKEYYFFRQDNPNNFLLHKNLHIVILCLAEKRINRDGLPSWYLFNEETISAKAQ